MKISDYMAPAPRTPKRAGARKFETYRAERRFIARTLYRKGDPVARERKWMRPVVAGPLTMWEEAPAGRQFDPRTHRELTRAWNRQEAGRWNDIAR